MSPSKPAANAPSAWIALGSNLGDRRAQLVAALRSLQQDAGAELVAVSSLYATAPVGLPGAPEFLNAVAEIRTALTPDELLTVCLAIEASQGRVRTGQTGSRTLDLDLLLYGDRSRAEARLTLPHPRLTERGFVLLPLAEISPDRLIAGVSAADWARRVGAAGVRRLPALPGWPPS
jgi:2-amino-4-hydroxy-6-hydroxymethyldihydropteridine diphosphokinase